MLFILISAAVVAVAVLILLPGLQLRSARRLLEQPQITLADYLKAVNDRRVTLAQVLGGLVVLAGLFYTSQTARLQERGQLTDRISKAMDQLGNKDETINLGAIHQLSRIADDYDEERYPVLQILSSYLEVRRALPGPLRPSDCDATLRRTDYELPALSSQAVIAVLADQIQRLEKVKAGALEINHANLRHVNFSGAKFGEIQLSGDDLTGAQFVDSAFSAGSLLASSLLIHADLSRSDLRGVKLQHVCMAQARLRDAALQNADLSYADFRSVEDLRGTDFTNAKLDHADMRSVDLTEAKGLTADQLKTVRCDELTQLPIGLTSIRDQLGCER